MLLQVCRTFFSKAEIFVSWLYRFYGRSFVDAWRVCGLLTWIELRQGQLVKDDFFTLFEAVGALEVESLHSNNVASTNV